MAPPQARGTPLASHLWQVLRLKLQAPTAQGCHLVEQATGTALSFQQLHDQAMQLAAALQAVMEGVGEEDGAGAGAEPGAGAVASEGAGAGAEAAATDNATTPAAEQPAGPACLLCGIHMEPSIDYVVTVLAALASG